MNTRSKRYRRWPCELTDVQIERIRELANRHEVYYTEMTRRLIDHALACPFFVPDASSGRNVQPPAEGA